ncbi:MAG: hypothetical protein M3304_01320 [Actinomycetota bacterium]|nr:hypothetical protein [Actinomycetota bacterium]
MAESSHEGLRRRVVRAAARVSAGLLALVGVYVVFVQLDVIRSPLDPIVRGDLELARSTDEGIRVLFVGNSFTYRNEMPALVQQLAAADEDAARIIAVEYVASNWSLRAASEDDGLARVVREVRWDVVVLQERSYLPALAPEARAVEMDPFAYALRSQIERAGAETMLFMAWGYENGDDSAVPGDTFTAMQERVAYGYRELGRNLDARVAPVGLAWAEALRRAPGVDLWADDGRHPSRRGSYLAACVFYAFLTEQSPVGNAFTGGLDRAEAAFLQRVAADVVLDYA